MIALLGLELASGCIPTVLETGDFLKISAVSFFVNLGA
jgi:hypothetical protein